MREIMISEVKATMDLVDRGTTTLADGVLALPPSNYTDAALFEKERQALFIDHPRMIGLSGRLPNPGDYVTSNDCGVPILVVRAADGSINAFLNICRHRGAPVAQGCGSGAKGFSCPYHAWTYGLDGMLRGIPGAKEGFPDVDKASHGLIPLEAEERSGMIWVMPNPDLPLNLEAHLAGIGAELEHWGVPNVHYFGTRVLDPEINWKLNVDTFGEGYHFDALHPETIAQLSYSNIAKFTAFGCNHRLTFPNKTISVLKDQLERDWNMLEHISFVYFLFPANVIFVTDKSIQNFRVVPGTAPGKSRLYHSYYMYEKITDEAARTAEEEFFGYINKVVETEDYAVVSKIQQGLTSGDRKMLFGRNEPALQAFQKNVACAVE